MEKKTFYQMVYDELDAFALTYMPELHNTFYSNNKNHDRKKRPKRTKIGLEYKEFLKRTNNILANPLATRISQLLNVIDTSFAIYNRDRKLCGRSPRIRTDLYNAIHNVYFDFGNASWVYPDGSINPEIDIAKFGYGSILERLLIHDREVEGKKILDTYIQNRYADKVQAKQSSIDKRTNQESRTTAESSTDEANTEKGEEQAE